MSGIMIVTGASRGIGAATARLAAERGFDVVVNYNRSEEQAERVATDARAKGVRAIAVQADVSNEDDVRRLFVTTERELGQPTALVNNAGTVGAFGRVEDVDPAMLRALLDLNVVAGFVCAREAIRRMSTRHGGGGGVIVNVSSLAARLGNANTWVWYAASKGAVDSFTIGLAREVGAEGIRVNAVAPGLVDTEIHAPAGGSERIAGLIADVPLGRVGTPDEVAECIVWLASPASAYVNGAILEVGGGR